jgi:hypothetical protein
MSRRKIVVNKKKKTKKARDTSVKDMMKFKQQLKLAENKENENAEVVSLIVSNELDVNKKDNYGYMKSVAAKLNWSTSRLLKTTDRVVKLLKEEEKNKEKEDEKSI